MEFKQTKICDKKNQKGRTLCFRSHCTLIYSSPIIFFFSSLFHFSLFNLPCRNKKKKALPTGSSSEKTVDIHDVPNLDNADWNKVENAWDMLWSSALIVICVLADDVLILHSIRKIDDSSAFWAKKKNFKFGDWPPDAIHWMEWPCICRRRAWGVVNAAAPWGLTESSCNNDRSITKMSASPVGLTVNK